MAIKNKAVKKWIKALRSGEYKQVKGRLTHAGRFCCLGVACDIQTEVPRTQWRFLASLEENAAAVADSLGLSSDVGHFEYGAFEKYPDADNLAFLNDDSKASFEEIADFIASNPPGLFKQDGPNVEEPYEPYEPVNC